MTLPLWLSLVAVCCLGAMSPGPSLAVVLRHTISNGRSHGIITAISHAGGVAIWAILTVLGLALLVTEQPALYHLITYVGAAYLAWMGFNAIRSKGSHLTTTTGVSAPYREAAQDGLMVSLLNPKLAVFFIALFSQFISAEQSRTDQTIMVLTASVIDALWYIIVAMLLSQSAILDKLQARSAIIDRVSGVIFLGLAIRVVTL